MRNSDVLGQRLSRLAGSFDESHLQPDPLQLVRRYSDPLDQETAGLIAAAFAYGRADIVVANVGTVLDKMGDSPYRYLRDDFSDGEANRRFARFRHRFHKTPELVALLGRIAQTLRDHGSLGQLFRACYAEDEPDIGPSLARFVGMILGEAPPAPRPVTADRADATRRALQYLLTSPADGSACKRMNLFLRWMVRRQPPDLGLWDFVSPSRLVMPLDTHVHRISTFLGLNARKSADWKAARMLTDRLADFDKEDPVRYDYAICRLGILDLCSRKRRKENCDVCMLNDVCRFPVS